MAAADAIRKLHTSMIDTRRAYEKAREETELPELKTFFEGMIALRKSAHDQLHKVLTEMGERPDEDGSFMTTVHRTVIAVRSAIKGVDHDALSAFASGEESMLQEYDDALAQEDIHPATAGLLTQQKAELVLKIDRMKAMQAAS